MADYKSIKGFKVQSLASDPTLVQGQVWYNTTGSVLKYQSMEAGALAAGGAIQTSRYAMGGSGTTPAGLIFGGNDLTSAESYNGTAWTEVTSLNTGKSNPGGIGVQTATLSAGGNPAPVSAYNEEYNGTSWTEEADLTTGRTLMGSCGTTTAGLLAGGGAIPGPEGGNLDIVEEWNGASWSEEADLNTARGGLKAGPEGTTTAAIVFGGRTTATNTTNTGVTEEYNGTAWTEVTALNTSRYEMGSGGDQDSAVSAGGSFSGPTQSVVEQWDGSSWTEVANLATSRHNMGAGGSGTDMFVAGGYTCCSPVGTITSTEEWTRALTVKTVTVS